MACCNRQLNSSASFIPYDPFMVPRSLSQTDQSRIAVRSREEHRRNTICILYVGLFGMYLYFYLRIAKNGAETILNIKWTRTVMYCCVVKVQVLCLNNLSRGSVYYIPITGLLNFCQAILRFVQFNRSYQTLPDT